MSQKRSSDSIPSQWDYASACQNGDIAKIGLFQEMFRLLNIRAGELLACCLICIEARTYRGHLCSESFRLQSPRKYLWLC